MTATGEKIEKNFDEKTVVLLLKQVHGNISAAAEALDVDRCTLYAYIKNHPVVTEILKDERQTMIDKAESVLWRAMESTDMEIALDASKYALDRIGRDRGYVTRQETDIVSGAIPAVLTEEMIIDDEPEEKPKKSAKRTGKR